MEIDEFDIQEKISKIVQKRHLQISEIKTYYDRNNSQPYKNIVQLGQNLNKLETIFSKEVYKLKCENIISITLSIGKIMDLNNSIKTILISIKIFKEHKNYLTHLNNNDKKTFITEIFEKIKENDFEKEDSNNKLIKIISNSLVNSNKFYSRMSINFESDYSSIIYSACDIFYMLYNKMMDNICYNPNFLPYIKELDEYIYFYFIKPCYNDLIKLSEFIIKNEMNQLNSSLERFYG